MGRENTTAAIELYACFDSNFLVVINDRVDLSGNAFLNINSKLGQSMGIAVPKLCGRELFFSRYIGGTGNNFLQLLPTNFRCVWS